MRFLFTNAFVKLLIILRLPLTKLLLSSSDRLSRYENIVKSQTISGMVPEFNKLQQFLFWPFYRRVQFLPADVQTLKAMTDPVVYVIKNRGQLEYQYFNYLFLKEKIALVHFAKGLCTLPWLPLKAMGKHLIVHLYHFYRDYDEGVLLQDKRKMMALLTANKSVMLSLRISRDYLFGLVKTDPANDLIPLVEIQKTIAQSISVVTVQFLYDKHPDKSELSYFDLLFGEKSQPGVIRKFILFLLNYRRHPRVKFGVPVELSDYIRQSGHDDSGTLARDLLASIEEDWRVEKARVTGASLKPKEALIKDILNDPELGARVGVFAKDHKLKPEDCLRDVQRYLDEVGADVNYSYLQFAHITLRHLWTKIFDGVSVKPDQLNRIREVAGKYPVVLVPMHRSHIDYLLISDLFYEHNITFPYVCGGINLNFWPVGRLIRKCGGFFIRRNFKGNYLYKEAVSAYVRALISQGHCLEFFIEGTRSRTGRQLSPKMGILSMVLRAYLEGACEDLYFVPIAVNYDHILEERSYQSEGTGDEKKQENAQELLKVRKVFKKKYGKVYIEFAEPISLKDYCRQHGLEQRPIDELKNEVAALAFTLTDKMTHVALVTPMTLVSTAVLSLNKKAFTYGQLVTRIETLKHYLNAQRVPYSDLINFSESYAYHEVVKKLCHRGLLKEAVSFEDNYLVIDEKHRSDFDYYKNNILHYFLFLSCFCKIVGRTEEDRPWSSQGILRQFETLKRLLQRDFIFRDGPVVFSDLEGVLAYGVAREFISYDPVKDEIRNIVHQKNQEEFIVFETLLDGIFEAQRLVLRFLKCVRVDQVETKFLIKEIMQKAKPMYLSDDLTHAEALSRFGLENSFKVLSDVGILIQKQTDSGHRLYTATNDEALYEQWTTVLQGLGHHRELG